MFSEEPVFKMIYGQKSSAVFDLTNHSPNSLKGFKFLSLEDNLSYTFTKLDGNKYCLCSEIGTIYKNPVESIGFKRITANFVASVFGSNTVSPYWRFIASSSSQMNPTVIGMKGVQYEY